MSQLQIYKASAGSGKTFRLAVEYLKLALANEWNYKHILAVTFTNKATTEMKYRVVQELYRLGQGKPSAYIDVLKLETGLTETELSNRARKCLKLILHDYSRLSISTIDSFFQRVIKAFNRELGINMPYQVDLDDDQILNEAVDALLLSVDEDRDLLEWLKQFAREKISEGSGWNLKNDILNLGKQIYNETFKELNQTLHEKINDKSFIQSYRKTLHQIVFQFENRLKQIGRDGLNLIGQAGLSVTDFKYGTGSAANSFNKMLKGEFEPGSRLMSAVEDVSALYKKSDTENVKAVALKIQPLLADAAGFYQKEILNYNTAKLISNQLYTLGILVDLQEMVRKISREKGVILISESGTLLRQIIADSETPFVYEKTGEFYRHFMIDEFQDTSGLQWNNFKPLIANSLAENNLGMVVGDVKQAIYRWRSGDWNLLATEVARAFPANGFFEQTLTSNWRSSGNVIRFNNRIFQLAPALLQEHFNAELSGSACPALPEDDQILQIYREGMQEIGRKVSGQDGYIRMRFMEHQKDKEQEDGNDESILDDLILQIRKLQNNGIPARDMAILVRKKEQARIVADRLLAEKEKNDGSCNFDVLSSESLYVDQASSVAFILSLLNLLIDPDDELSLAFANYEYYSGIGPKLARLGKKPFFKPEDAGQLSMDFHEPYQPDLAAQFEKIGVEQNELYGFLKGDSFTDTLGSRNLQEVIFKICEIFHLLDLKEEQAYLQAFIDQISSFMRNRTADISSFLLWWKEQGRKKTIAVSEELDAITIQTFHKAKGLEYEYVFIPFCDWSLDILPLHAPVLWCKPSSEPFSRLELVPVKYSTVMGKSLFWQAYYTEKMNNYIDNLNLLYVAFTRARQALFTWSVFSEKLSSIGDLLYQSILLDIRQTGENEEQLDFTLSAFYNKEKNLFEYGHTAFPEKERNRTDKAVRPGDFCFTDFSNHLNLRKNYEHFFESDGDPGRNINRGRLIHDILSRISTAVELDKAIEELVFQGILSAEEIDEIRDQLTRLVSDPEVKHWFDGTFRVVNERNILTGKNGVKRPDRIMLADDQLIVVDYKSGEQELDKYKSQVRGYMRELHACGYKNITGYIWYTRNNKRVKVDFL